MVYLCGRPLRNRGRCTLGRETAIQPMVWGADGWLRTIDGEGIPIVGRAGARGLPPHAASADADARGVRRRRAADRLPVAAHRRGPTSCSASRARPGHLRLYGRETIGSLFRAGARRAPAAVALLQRVDGRGVRAGALPADGRPRLLLQQREVPLPLRLARRRRRQAPARDVGAARSGAGRRVHAADRDPAGRADRTARRSRLRAAALRVSAWTAERLAVAAAAVRRQHPLGRSDARRGCRTSPARSSAWPARTWPAPRCPPISTSSSTASANTSAMCHGWRRHEPVKSSHRPGP